MRKSLIAALVCSAIVAQPVMAAPVAVPAVQPVQAAVLPAVAGGKLVTEQGTANLVEVRWRGHGHHRYHHRHRRGSSAGAFGAGLAVGIVGALIASGVSEAAARDRYARCAAEFRSFDPETGTYIAYGGEERLCPYLR